MKVEKVSFTTEGKRVGGFLYLPEGKGKFPAVILVPGFGGLGMAISPSRPSLRTDF
ncbi:hypothetical protein HYX14_01490 [Candidatus Woesearchaeota archaeon]|nr:hypothetical protein [Candidatus Woesearchaeota archaeon]